jgi:hypothetical protein
MQAILAYLPVVDIMKSTLVVQPANANIAKNQSTSDVLAETGETVETLKLFAAVHKSTLFSLDAAHQLFAGVQPKSN